MRRLRLKISSIALAGTIVLSLAGMAESGAAQAKAIVQQVAAGQLLAQDTFQRANQTFWGTASDGQRWGGDANFITVLGRTKVLPQLLGETRALLAAAWRS